MAEAGASAVTQPGDQQHDDSLEQTAIDLAKLPEYVTQTRDGIEGLGVVLSDEEQDGEVPDDEAASEEEAKATRRKFFMDLRVDINAAKRAVESALSGIDLSVTKQAVETSQRLARPYQKQFSRPNSGEVPQGPVRSFSHRTPAELGLAGSSVPRPSYQRAQSWHGTQVRPTGTYDNWQLGGAGRAGLMPSHGPPFGYTTDPQLQFDQQLQFERLLLPGLQPHQLPHVASMPSAFALPQQGQPQLALQTPQTLNTSLTSAIAYLQQHQAQQQQQAQAQALQQAQHASTTSGQPLTFQGLHPYSPMHGYPAAQQQNQPSQPAQFLSQLPSAGLSVQNIAPNTVLGRHSWPGRAAVMSAGTRLPGIQEGMLGETGLEEFQDAALSSPGMMPSTLQYPTAVSIHQQPPQRQRTPTIPPSLLFSSARLAGQAGGANLSSAGSSNAPSTASVSTRPSLASNSSSSAGPTSEGVGEGLLSVFERVSLSAILTAKQTGDTETEQQLLEEHNLVNAVLAVLLRVSTGAVRESDAANELSYVAVAARRLLVESGRPPSGSFKVSLQALAHAVFLLCPAEKTELHHAAFTLLDIMCTSDNELKQVVLSLATSTQSSRSGRHAASVSDLAGQILAQLARTISRNKATLESSLQQLLSPTMDSSSSAGVPSLAGSQLGPGSATSPVLSNTTDASSVLGGRQWAAALSPSLWDVSADASSMRPSSSSTSRNLSLTSGGSGLQAGSSRGPSTSGGSALYSNLYETLAAAQDMDPYGQSATQLQPSSVAGLAEQFEAAVSFARSSDDGNQGANQSSLATVQTMQGLSPNLLGLLAQHQQLQQKETLAQAGAHPGEGGDVDSAYSASAYYSFGQGGMGSSMTGQTLGTTLVPAAHTINPNIGYGSTSAPLPQVRPQSPMSVATASGLLSTSPQYAQGSVSSLTAPLMTTSSIVELMESQQYQQGSSSYMPPPFTRPTSWSPVNLSPHPTPKNLSRPPSGP